MLYYLPRLQKHLLWKINFAVGNLVLVAGQKMSCSHYPLGRIIKLEPEKLLGVETVRRVVVRLANRNALYPKSPLDCMELRRDVSKEEFQD